jgi:hypothetical protein
MHARPSQEIAQRVKTIASEVEWVAMTFLQPGKDISHKHPFMDTLETVLSAKMNIEKFEKFTGGSSKARGTGTSGRHLPGYALAPLAPPITDDPADQGPAAGDDPVDEASDTDSDGHANKRQRTGDAGSSSAPTDTQ